MCYKAGMCSLNSSARCRRWSTDRPPLSSPSLKQTDRINLFPSFRTNKQTDFLFETNKQTNTQKNRFPFAYVASSDSPAHNWPYVQVVYCTSDLHLGSWRNIIILTKKRAKRIYSDLAHRQIRQNVQIRPNSPNMCFLEVKCTTTATASAFRTAALSTRRRILGGDVLRVFMCFLDVKFTTTATASRFLTVVLSTRRRIFRRWRILGGHEFLGGDEF